MSASIFDYQETGAAWLAERRFAILGDQPRVGKTPQAIQAVDRVGARRAHVTCPAIAVGVWHEAIERWGWGLCDWSVTSYDKAAAGGLPVGADVYIFDEAHRLANIQAQRTQRLLGPASPCRDGRHVWALSGTIAPNHAGELFPWLRFAGVFEGGYFDFMKAYLNWFMGDYGPKVMGNKASARSALLAMIEPIFLRRTRAAVFPSQALPVWGDIRLASNVGHSRLKLDNFLIVDDILPTESKHMASLRRAVGEVKATPLAEHLARGLQASGEKIAVYGWHTSVLDLLEQGLSDFGLVRIDGSTPATKRTQRVAAFRDDPAMRVLLGQTVAAGEAVDLSQADRLVMAEMAWSPGANAQVAARMGGPNQRGTPQIHTTTLRGSIDEALNGVLARKTRALEEIYGDAA
jgi:SWI/SNF-related matrix-associated actin-dependent regulator of chromatin subfamily A-like protein 1